MLAVKISLYVYESSHEYVFLNLRYAEIKILILYSQCTV